MQVIPAQLLAPTTWQMSSVECGSDPTAEEAAVRGYLREIAEASVSSDTVDMADAPLIVAFSPSWPEGSI